MVSFTPCQCMCEGRAAARSTDSRDVLARLAEVVKGALRHVPPTAGTFWHDW